MRPLVCVLLVGLGLLCLVVLCSRNSGIATEMEQHAAHRAAVLEGLR